ncbi:phospholipid-binding protein MlaC [Methylobacterium sp. J-090]|uniref:MlaC/ttg2D family ABC transporter substrate-binding protein n=1 Tax=Methylobacterium sp. J-090 TaxID=2836666 RepID=UPI001FB98CF0|nr:ABC transporter substrate-binding protein [Methylobacterium sp. J-090]MCJ2082918.1 ABC transporter substrate-binding protein [Methylobacterium sp. J-090]
MRLIPILRAGLVAGLLAAGCPARAADDPAVGTVRTLYTSFEAALKGGPGDARTRAAAIGPTLKETIDFPAMVRVAVGPKWKGFTPEQQGALTEAFGQYFIATYATRLAQAAGGKFDVKPRSEARGANRLVQSGAANADGESSQVDYLVGPGNRIQDVYLNGNVSEVAALRGSFADPLKAAGADGLLKFLRERTTGMLAAKPAP